MQLVIEEGKYCHEDCITCSSTSQDAYLHPASRMCKTHCCDTEDVDEGSSMNSSKCFNDLLKQQFEFHTVHCKVGRITESPLMVAGTSPQDVREAAGNAGLRAPYLGKPLFADGREGSHGLLVIKDESGLQQVAAGPRPNAPSLPIVLQQYVPHGACLFKVRTLFLSPYFPPSRQCFTD